MRNTLLLCLAVVLLGFGTTHAQTRNFDETWKEFLVNNRISDMSVLPKPDRRTDLQDYAKYVLMNLNNTFCQSEMDRVDALVADLDGIERERLVNIPGFVKKWEEIKSKIDAYHKMDELWQQFRETRRVSPRELNGIAAAKSSCEKSTLAKYSFMMAHYNLCRGDIESAKDIFQTRTLRLAEKTSLRINDIEGLPEEVARMKRFFTILPRLDAAWDQYVTTGTSPGFTEDIPAYPCYPDPQIRILVLNAATDLCANGPDALAQIEALQNETGYQLSPEVAKRVESFTTGVNQRREDLAALNAAWEAFLPNNEVPVGVQYSYDYCEKLPLIRAYIMDGFAFVCETAEANLMNIADLQRENPVQLDAQTRQKMEELQAKFDQYIFNGEAIDQLWRQFMSQGDTLYGDFMSSEVYCDNIQQVKDWTMRGLSGNCGTPEMYQMADRIDELQAKFDFQFYDDLDCRVQKLRMRVWDCRYEALHAMASVEEDAAQPFEQRLQAMMDEHGMGPRPEPCGSER